MILEKFIQAQCKLISSIPHNIDSSSYSFRYVRMKFTHLGVFCENVYK